LPIEDILVPGGAYEDLQIMRWVGLRWWLTEGELADKAREKDWDIEQCQPVGVVGWTRSRREQLGHTSSTKFSELYEIFEVYCYFDIDGDGYEEDLCVAWDQTSQHVLKVGYNGYDHRPIESMVYQLRAHLFFGVGVMDMLKNFEEEATEIHNHRITNMLLANSRMWAGKNLPETKKIWPPKVIRHLKQPHEDVDANAIDDVYPSHQEHI
jgi:hypothetical protein